MKIKAHCPFLGYTGYNAHTRGFFTALSHLIDLRVDNYTWCDDRHNYLTNHQKHIISEVTLGGPDGQDQYAPDWKKTIEEFDYDVDIVLHEHNHHHFWRDYSKPKIAYTVWETDLYSKEFFDRILEYDELWVPSEWQRECSVEQGYPAHRVKVVPEAVESDCFPDEKIVPDDSIFTFCLLGRWDNRKSTTEILECFVELFGNNPKVQLIASINNPFAEDGLSTEERLKEMGWGDVKNIILKSFPSRPDYIDILRRSHVFLSCARSEGWNIPLIEAMACGVPSIYSDCSGQTEFASGKGIPIRILGKELARIGHGAVASEFTSQMPGHYYVPDFTHLRKKMQMCIDKYGILKKKALQESIDIRSKFTWENAALIAQRHLSQFSSKIPKQKTHLLLAANNNYLKYAQRCINSLKKHSSLPIVLYGYDTDFQGAFAGTDIQVRRLRPWPLTEDGRDFGLMGSRISMCLDAIKQYPEDRFIALDSDMVAITDIDDVFNQHFAQLENYPLHLTYKHDNLIHFRIDPDGNKTEKGHGEEAAEVFKLPSRNVDFTVAHGIFIFDQRSQSFLTRLLELSIEALAFDSSTFIDDLALESERIENALFWKEGFTKHLPLSWVSRDEDNDFLQSSLKKYIDKGYDIVYTHTDRRSYDIKDDQLLFLHGPGPASEVTKLMVVAHPDDETIFGFSELYSIDKLEGRKWKVVCATGDNRTEDFYKAMDFFGIAEYEVWDFDSSVHQGFSQELLDSRIKNLLNSQTWEKVVTHNPCGEYGHIQHKNVFDAIKKHRDDFYVFCKSPLKLEPKELRHKNKALENYNSEDIINQLRGLNGDWYIMPDPSTNYIEYGMVEKYDPQRDTTPFINCWEKTPDYSPSPFKAKEVFLVTSFCDNFEKTQLLKETITHLKPFGIPICVHDAAGIRESLTEVGADYVIVDSSNPIPPLEDRNVYSSWSPPLEDDIVFNSHSLDVGSAATHQLKSGLLYLYSLGYNIAHTINYDVFIDHNFFSNTASPKALKHDAVLYYWDRGLSTCFYSINLTRYNEILRSMGFEDYISTVPHDGHFEDYVERKIASPLDLTVDKVPFQDFKNLIYDKMSFYTGIKDNKDGTFDYTRAFTEPLTPKTQLWFGRKKTPELPEGGPASVIFYDIKESFEAQLIVNGKIFEAKVEKSQATDYFLLESTIKGNNIESAQLVIDGEVIIDKNKDNVLLNSIEFLKNE